MLRPAPERDLMTHDSCLCSSWLLLAIVPDKKDPVLVSASHYMGNAEGYGGSFLPKTMAQHYNLCLTNAHCGHRQSRVEFFSLVLCKNGTLVVEEEKVAHVRHLLVSHTSTKPQ